jgi:hypothetical protein
MFHSSPRKAASRLGLVLVLAVLLPACVGGSNRRVGLKSLAADLVFGIPPLEEPVAPPDTLPNTSPVRDLGDTPPPPSLGGGAIAGGVQSRGCPAATVNEVAERAGDVPGDSRPAAGQYFWKQGGYQTLPPPVGQLPVASSLIRHIVGVKELETPGDFEYGLQDRAQDAGGEVRVTEFFQVIQSRPDPRPGGSPNIVRDEGSINGVFLARIEQQRGDQRPRVFSLNPPALYIPLPVVPGFERTTQAADPASLVLLTHHIHVQTRERYDACGTLVDSWFVDGDQTFSSPDETFQRNYDYGIATQMGGLLVAEHIHNVDDTLKLDRNIGQIDPD